MEQKMEEKKAKQEEHVNPAASGSKSGTGGGGGGDLMSDLASKLAMRRKGISGNQAGIMLINHLFLKNSIMYILLFFVKFLK